MKNSIKLIRSLIMTGILSTSLPLAAQQTTIQYFRPYNKMGINIFETTKKDTISFKGLKVKVGGNFTQDFQAIAHQNNATPVYVDGINTNELMSLTNGFNLAMANLNLDVQLDDGIRMNLVMYLSSRHHLETWVKGGYLQFDKLPFFKNRVVDSIMKNFTIKAGNYEVNYGDQHFRRSDGGNAMFNPFIENYIMDEFTTEVGCEILYHPKNGFIAMAGITNGQINPTVAASTKLDSATGKWNKYAPAYLGKIGYDKQFNKDVRYRITASFYTIKSTSNSTVFFGDRTGSRYFFIMENSTATSSGSAWSGRYNPKFSQQVNTFMINPFIKFKGCEFFGTYELASGRMITEKEMRKATQYSIDFIYRFPREKEFFWIGGRYNSVTAKLPLVAENITIDRVVGSVGWFITKNMVVKLEYVNQQYKNFISTDIRSGGKFDGFMMEASIGF